MLKELDSSYIERLEAVAQEIQSADELAAYLEEEDEAYYTQLKEIYEPKIAAIYEEVAAKHPLQLVHFEKIILHEAFEGLYLPRILGFAALRGQINSRCKYILPQEHFLEILMTICESPNFDILKKRIGQTIQVGFALSSDIRITNLLNDIQNKRIRNYLKAQKGDNFRVQSEREILLNRYKRQFRDDNFYSAEFPTNVSELNTMFTGLKAFLQYRIKNQMDNSSLVAPLMAFVKREEFHGTTEHLQITVLFASFFELDDAQKAEVKEVFNKIRTSTPDFEDKYFDFILDIQNGDVTNMSGEAEMRMSGMVDKSVTDTLTDYYTLMDSVHSNGYNTEQVQDEVRVFDSKHEGKSKENEAVRRAIFNYFNQFISNLEPTDYTEFFEITKLYPIYMKIFANQQFNQDLKELSMKYVKRLLKHFTNKRDKDYQDIKKFVAAMFPEFGFLKEKDVKELFKTRRKRRKKAEA
ncbi:MAG: hypothetical protein AAGI23_13845 [Bacteroidota bacterium]